MRLVKNPFAETSRVIPSNINILKARGMILCRWVSSSFTHWPSYLWFRLIKRLLPFSEFMHWQFVQIWRSIMFNERILVALFSPEHACPVNEVVVIGQPLIINYKSAGLCALVRREGGAWPFWPVWEKVDPKISLLNNLKNAPEIKEKRIRLWLICRGGASVIQLWSQHSDKGL